MLKLTLRLFITLVDIGLLIALWWVVTQPAPITPPPEVVSVNVEDITPEEVALILEATGADEDGGILNEDNQ